MAGEYQDNIKVDKVAPAQVVPQLLRIYEYLLSIMTPILSYPLLHLISMMHIFSSSGATAHLGPK